MSVSKQLGYYLGQLPPKFVCSGLEGSVQLILACESLSFAREPNPKPAAKGKDCNGDWLLPWNLEIPFGSSGSISCSLWIQWTTTAVTRTQP